MKPGHASATAKLIAAATLLLARDEHASAASPAHAALVPPQAARLCRALLSGSTGDRLLRASAEHGATRWLWRALERATLPGIVRHYALRLAQAGVSLPGASWHATWARSPGRSSCSTTRVRPSSWPKAC
jgi:hypothetical protein